MSLMVRVTNLYASEYLQNTQFTPFRRSRQWIATEIQLRCISFWGFHIWWALFISHKYGTTGWQAPYLLSLWLASSCQEIAVNWFWSYVIFPPTATISQDRLSKLQAITDLLLKNFRVYESLVKQSQSMKPWFLREDSCSFDNKYRERDINMAWRFSCSVLQMDTSTLLKSTAVNQLSAPDHHTVTERLSFWTW